MRESSVTKTTKQRPSALRALGKNDPPEWIEVDGARLQRVEIYKHDNWAATARYAGDGKDLVCKFNRTNSLMLVPMSWLGRWLARREAWMLRALADLPTIPPLAGDVLVEGRVARTAVAHDFVPGRPLSKYDELDSAFFRELEELIATMHARRIAYVDLHKRSNILVGEDNRPYLIDFQISFACPSGFWGRIWPISTAFNMLAASDRYHLQKHIAQANLKDRDLIPKIERPWWIRLHRWVAVPFRFLRRRLLVALGVRRSSGHEHTEAAPEAAIQLEKAAQDRREAVQHTTPSTHRRAS
jgi:hypothetical protein